LRGGRLNNTLKERHRGRVGSVAGARDYGRVRPSLLLAWAAVVLLAMPGFAAGVALSAVLARGMKSMVSLVSPADPISIAGAAVFLVMVTLVSAWLPATRAAAVDAASALRAE